MDVQIVNTSRNCLSPEEIDAYRGIAEAKNRAEMDGAIAKLLPLCVPTEAISVNTILYAVATSLVFIARLADDGHSEYGEEARQLLGWV